MRDGFMFAFGGLFNYQMWVIDPTHEARAWALICEDSSCEGGVPTGAIGASLVTMKPNDSSDDSFLLFYGGLAGFTVEDEYSADVYRFDFGACKGGCGSG